MSELRFSPNIWALVDPTKDLDRSPATLSMDLSADVEWGLNTLDFPSYVTLEQTGEVPFKLESIDLRSFALSSMGAALNAVSSFTFDNMDDSFFGFPTPVGGASIDMTGANALIAQIAALGLVDDSQLGMARLGMGMFTRETGEDSFETRIEINEDGHIFANGERVR